MTDTDQQPDPNALSAWLAEHAPDLVSEGAALSLQQFKGGHSNRTFGVTAGERRWVLRMPPLGKVAAGAHDISRECRVLEAVAPHFDRAPGILARCDDAAVLGAPFYLMAHLPGTIVRKDFPKDWKTSEDENRRLSMALIQTLADIHAIPTGAGGVDGIGSPEGYVGRQLSGWRKRYDDSSTRTIAAADDAFAWLDAHLPLTDDDCVIHNDFKFDNVTLDRDTCDVVGVLDWELATRGHPLVDLGGVLAAWVEAGDPLPVQLMRLGPTQLPGMLTRQELVDAYAVRSGRDVSAWQPYYVFGLVRLGVVAQQLYHRFVTGQSKDPRFGALEYAIPALFDWCTQRIEVAEAA